MASDLHFIEYVCDQIRDAGAIAFRKMFGDYAIYCNGKVIALVCDNQFFLKPTAGGRALMRKVVEGIPYPGAKPYFLIDEGLDDREEMVRLVQATEREVPAPKPKTSKPSKKAP
jgi:TfoX/Sxy family transcriptional regulator of competence genes